MFCPECGIDIPNESRFCFRCGHSLERVVALSQEPSQTEYDVFTPAKRPEPHESCVREEVGCKGPATVDTRTLPAQSEGTSHPTLERSDQTGCFTCEHCGATVFRGQGYSAYSEAIEGRTSNSRYFVAIGPGGVEAADRSAECLGGVFYCDRCGDTLFTDTVWEKAAPVRIEMDPDDVNTVEGKAARSEVIAFGIALPAKRRGWGAGETRDRSRKLAVLWWTDRDAATNCLQELGRTVASGRFVKKRVLPLQGQGQYRGQGRLETTAAGLRVVGRHVYPVSWRLTLILTVLAGVFIITRGAVFGGLIPTLLVALVGEYLWLKEETLEIPFSRVTGVAADAQSELVAVTFTGCPNCSPVVLQSRDSQLLANALRSATASRPPNANANRLKNCDLDRYAAPQSEPEQISGKDRRLKMIGVIVLLLAVVVFSGYLFIVASRLPPAKTQQTQALSENQKPAASPVLEELSVDGTRKLDAFRKLMSAIGDVNFEPRELTFKKMVQILHSKPQRIRYRIGGLMRYSWLDGAVLADFLGGSDPLGELVFIELHKSIESPYNRADWQSQVSLCGIRLNSNKPNVNTHCEDRWKMDGYYFQSADLKPDLQSLVAWNERYPQFQPQPSPRFDPSEFQSLLDAIGHVNLEPDGMTYSTLARILRSAGQDFQSNIGGVVSYSWLHSAVVARFFRKDNGAPGDLYSIELAKDIYPPYNQVDYSSHISLCGLKAFLGDSDLSKARCTAPWKMLQTDVDIEVYDSRYYLRPF